MGTEENLETVRRAFAAFGTGDTATLNDMFAEDAVWHAAGSGVMSAPQQGRSAILAYFGELMARSGGTYPVSVLDIAGSGERVYVLQHSHAERDGKVLDHDVVQVFRLADGVTTEVWEFYQDTGAYDAFWA